MITELGTALATSLRSPSTWMRARLSFATNGVSHGVAFANLPEEGVYPAINVYEANDSVKIALTHNNAKAPRRLAQAAVSRGALA
jgi:hypothetical protein